MILFIDDDAFGMKPYRLALEQAGYEVVVAPDPDAAMIILKEKSARIELVLLDVLMPTGQLLAEEDVELGLRTGIRLLHIIGRSFPDVPVILFSITNIDDVPGETRRVPAVAKADTMPQDLVRIAREHARSIG